MNKSRKTSHILNVFQYDETTGAVTLPSTLSLTAPSAGDNSSKVATTAWARTFVASLSYLTSGTTTTSDIGEGTNLYYTQSRFNTAFGLKTTTDLTEGANLYYTDSRVGTYLTNNSYATQSYVGTQLANLVAAAPATLDTLNELAAALGNDPSFATTVTTSIGTKVPQARTLTINGTTYDLSANRSWTITSMIYPGAGIAVSTGTAWGTSITDNSTNWNTAYGWGNHASGGYLTSATAATTYASLTGAYANPAFVASLAYSKITGVPAFLTSYTETDPYRVTAVAVSGTSTKTITITRADASTVTTTWTDIDTDTNTYITSAAFSGGTLTLTRNDAGTVSVSLDGRYYLTTNPSGYITGITSSMVTTALGYTPYNSTNPNGYITGITSSNVTTALGYTPYNSSNPSGYITSSALSSYLPLSGGTLSGTLSLNSYSFSGDFGAGKSIYFAVGYTSTRGINFGWDTTNDRGFIGSVYNGQAWKSLDLQPISGSVLINGFTAWHSGNLTNLNQLSNGPGYITGITSSNVTTALGYTPYNSTNPSGYISSYTETSTLANVTARGATTTAAITTGVLTVNTGGTGTWGPFVVTSTSQWGDGATQYVTIGAGGAAGIMINNPHIVWNASEVAAVMKFGRSGGTSSGSYYNIGTGASNNFFINKDGVIASPILNINSSGNATFSGTLSASNLSGTNTGDQTNISGNAATTSQRSFDYLYASSYLESAGAVYGTIFYDNNDRAYYLNPAGGSRLRNLYVGDSGDDWSDPGGWGTQVRFSNGPHVKFVLHARTPGIEAGMYVHTPGSVYIGSYTSHDVSMMYAGSRKMQITNSYIYTDVYLEAAGSLRAPIFYDSNDTGYYLDPNGTSNLYKFSEFTMAYNGMNPMSANSPYSSRYSGSANYRNGTMGYGNTDFNVMFSNWGSGFIDSWSSPANAPGGSSHYVGLQGFHYNYQNSSQAYGFQMACAGEADNRFFWRSAWPNLRGWVEMIHSGNIGSQKVNGAQKLWAESHPNDYYIVNNWTGSHWRLTTNHGSPVRVGYSDDTGAINSAVGSSYYWSGIQYFETNNGGSAVNNSNSAKLEAYSSSNNTAFMSFHRGGYYAVNFGLDNDNVMRIGGWSAGANRWQLDMSGNMTVAGDVTAYSDARVKENIITVDNALTKVLSLRGVYYNRIDSDDKKTKIGVIAQETLLVVPEVVNQDNDGMFNVSYGNLAGLFIEAIKEQQKEIEELKTIIYGLTR